MGTRDLNALAVRLADRVAAARRRRFVGRRAELELLRTALADDEPPFAVLHVYGPGGVGKSTLLGEYARLAEEVGARAIRLDGRGLEASPDGFLQGLRVALGLSDGEAALPSLHAEGRSVLLIDTYEQLAPLDGWLRGELLPGLPGRSVVVIAGRSAPAPAWRTEPGWRELVRVLALRNLAPEESRSYLTVRGVPDDQHRAALEMTHGHPLALALVADLLAQQEGRVPLGSEPDPDVVGMLLKRFVDDVPGARRREALEICAHVRTTSEALLARAMGHDAAELFEWLRGLSFVEQGPEGLFPHDAAREALEADLRWRNPERYRALHRRLRELLVSRLGEAKGMEQQRAYFDLLYLHRRSPLMKPYYDWKTLGDAYVEPAATRDWPALLAMAERHEGAESRRIAEHWLRRQPGSFTAFRGAGGAPIGFVAVVALQQATPEDMAADPAARAAWEFAVRYGPARPGEEVALYRYWMGADQLASPTMMSLLSMHSTLHWLTTPRLAWSFLVLPEAAAAHWHPTLTYVNLRRSPEAECAVAGRRYAVYVHDWRAEPAAVWLEVMGERELATDLTVEGIEAQRAVPLVVLSQPDFYEAVRRALREYTRPAQLASSPLLRSRVVTQGADDGAVVEALRRLLREAVEGLEEDRRDEKLGRAVRRTYLQPAATQELAAEALGLPFSTYRRHLTAGVERIAEELWRREVRRN
ncbi:MAG TPA: ATP-binding protein [Chloroflexota bacterium]|nr:ATP-binding protein [Chloroflexota bacterium]